MTDAVERLRAHPAFTSLSEKELARVVAAGGVYAFADDDLLLREGEASDSALFVLEGEIVVETATSYGSVTLAAFPGPALLGEIGVFADLPRTATVRARSAGWALRIPLRTMQEIGRANPDILQQVISQLGRKIQSFNQAIGTYTNALAALENEEENGGILDDLLNPPPELTNFAITFRKLAEQIKERRVRLREMASAAAIQRAMLPSAAFADEAGRLDVHAAFRPARDVGGDFYDIFRIDADRVAITVGDVSGKGVPASLFMAVCQTVMRLVLRQEPDLGRAVSRASDLLDADNTESMFATFFGAVLNLATGELVYCNCGHNPPMVLRADGRAEPLVPAWPEPPLATWSPAEYQASALRLAPGDGLLVFTDGVTEAHDRAAELFGDERLAALAATLPGRNARDAADAVIAAVDAFVGEAPQFDDLTCLALTFRPGSRGSDLS